MNTFLAIYPQLVPTLFFSSLVAAIYFFVTRDQSHAAKKEERTPRFASRKKISTPTLGSFSVDFTALAAQEMLDPVVGRQKEVVRLSQVLSRRTKNNAILLGQPGVGKTAIVEALAQRIVSGEVPDVLKDKRVLSLNVSNMVAGTKYRGEFEQRAKKIVQEIQRANRMIILFIDEFHVVIQSQGAEGAVNFADILKPALARGDLQLIGATTGVEYKKYIESDSALVRRFQLIEVGEPNEKETMVILEGVKDKYRKYHKVEFTDAALDVAIRETKQFIKDRRLPDKAIDALDEAGAMIKVSHLHGAVPHLLSDVAIAQNPSASKIWKSIQSIDKKIMEGKKTAKEKKEMKKKREALEEKLSEIGVVAVDSTDITTVIEQWRNKHIS